jgi:predicted negative regulator of RcsB-dependent stress response
MTQEWQNGDINLLAQDKPLIQGTTLLWLLQTSQEHKLAWLAQIRLARLAYATIQEDDTPTNADTEANETAHAP